ncbi:exodeoxyribonuclease V subunit alpha [Nocardioides pacificus]
MTELFEPLDAHDRRLALGTPEGLLHRFNDAGVLTAADVHVARRLSLLAGEGDESVQLALALATRAVRHGSVCVRLDLVAELVPVLPDGLAWPEPDAWEAAIERSPLVEAGVLRQEFGLLYLDRYHRQETTLAADLSARLLQPAPEVDEPLLAAGLARIFPHESDTEQRVASQRAARQWTTVLTGGPGTGKTTTVARLLALLAEQAETGAGPGQGAGSSRRMRVALTAPTGKAAARLQEAVAHATADLPEADRARLRASAAADGMLRATTMHRLLGTLPDNGTRFRHHRGNRLPHDVVVVDEASMVSLTLMARLVEAVRPDARLVVVGDPDQLASVEAGAVLADLVGGLRQRGEEGRGQSKDEGEGSVTSLTRAHRFGSEIGRLAAALRAGDADLVLEVLRAGGPGVEFVETSDPTEALRRVLLPPALALRAAAETGDAASALGALAGHRFLCAHRHGPYGVQTWNRRVEQWITEATGDPLRAPMYVGRPLLVTANDHALDVYNGDTGVVLRGADGAPRVLVSAVGGALDLAPTRLGDVDTMHAMTIHKSQGSQAREVTVLLPDPESRLLTRELLYTAVTRAQDTVRVVGTEADVRAAVARQVQRASGLAQRLARRRVQEQAPS